MSKVSRRDLLAGAASAGAAAVLPGAAGAQQSAPRLVAADGTYATVPLVRDVITVGVVQTRSNPVDVSDVRRSVRSNLNHMLEQIDISQGWAGKKDLLHFHEFPITGFRPDWDRKDIMRFALEIPGEETEALGRKAREHDCYIVFGTYAKDRDWPDHILSLTTIIGPDGTVLDKHWKARSIKGVFRANQPIELMTTTIFNVYDRYVEMYGLDAVLPVTRTPVGNIATSTVQREPELIRALAMKGAELMIRSALWGFTMLDIQAGAMYNNVYTLICNNAVSPQAQGTSSDPGGGSGGSAVVGPRGQLLATANSMFEHTLQANIPMAEFRAGRRIPQVHMDLYREAFDQYQGKYPRGLFQDYLPSSWQDSGRYLADKARWK